MNKSKNSANFAENQQVVDAVKQIRRLILASMDGVTAEKLRAASVENRQNLGVSVPRLREIAMQFEPNSEVSQCLWRIGTRECKIVALCLLPNDMNTVTLSNYLERIDTLELAEVAAMCLASKCTDFESLVAVLLHFENKFARVLLYNVCSRRVEQLSFCQISTVVEDASHNNLTQFEATALLNFLLHVHDAKRLNATDFGILFDTLIGTNNAVCRRVANELKEIIEL